MQILPSFYLFRVQTIKTKVETPDSINASNVIRLHQVHQFKGIYIQDDNIPFMRSGGTVMPQDLNPAILADRTGSILVFGILNSEGSTSFYYLMP